MHEASSADDDAALEHLRAATATLRRIAEQAAFAQPVHPVVLQDWLAQALRKSTGARGFLAGAVTIGALLPMRAVPVRRLFVCGLDDASFPRRDHAVAFDLIAAHPRRGDRSARSDDRQMFLDVLMAAREQLHLTFVGRSQKDDSECAPSVVLAELLDQIDSSCAPPPGCAHARDAVMVQHPLQPWSRRYRSGEDPRLFTFTRADLEVPGQPDAEHTWFTAPPPPRTAVPEPQLTIASLIEFWWHPCRFFLRHVARIRLPKTDDADDASEPFAVDALERWRLQDEIVRRALRGDPPPRDPCAYMRATGRLPAGGHGDVAFASVDDEAQHFLRELRRYGVLRPRPVAIAFEGATLHGEIPDVGGDTIVQARMAKLKPKDRLRAWIRHVLAAVARTGGDPGWPEATHVIGKDKWLEFAPLAADVARQQLATLVAGFRAGIRAPLPFFENASQTFGKQLHDGKPDKVARRAALRVFEPEPGEFGRDGDDADIRLCWRGADALGADGFSQWAKDVWCQVHGHATEHG